MGSRFAAAVAAATVLALGSACGVGDPAATTEPTVSLPVGHGEPPAVDPTATVTEPAPVHQQPDRVEQLLDAMTLREKVRQLLVVHFSGTEVPKHLIRTVQPGGVIYFADNLVDPDQVRRLSRGLQRVSRAEGLPLLLSTDQEGGPVTRLPGKVSDLPGGAELDGDAVLARDVAHRTARAMSRMGLNLNFAPVADVNTAGDAGVIGARAFGSGPRVVSRLVRAQVCGYHAGGVAATAKHFPGHGSTTVDSHESRPSLRLTRAEWRRMHRSPFEAGIGAGVDAVMVGHLAFPMLDPRGIPATFSRPMVTRWLRGRLGFEGVVVTDSLVMGAVVSRGTSGELAVRAVRAGADLLLMPARPGAAARGLVQAVRGGALDSRRIDHSVERVLRLKERLGLFGSPPGLGAC